jgi:iron-sulfur cluster insertion protein
MKISETGLTRIRELNSSNQKLRVYVQGGGCAGLGYGFAFDNTVDFDDVEIDINGQSIIVDVFSKQMLSSTMIDFEDTLITRRLILSGLGGCDCRCSFTHK